MFRNSKSERVWTMTYMEVRTPRITSTWCISAALLLLAAVSGHCFWGAWGREKTRKLLTCVVYSHAGGAEKV